MIRKTICVLGRLFVAMLVLVSLVFGESAQATPSGWKPTGGVTDPTQYTDYGSSVIGNQYQSDIERATELGLVVGHDDRSYRPNDNVTVGQFANIVARNYWQQGASEGQNLAYLGSLGVSVDDPNASLTVDQLKAIADALTGRTGLADLAVLDQVRNGSLVPSGTGGAITRGQAVDLAGTGGSVDGRERNLGNTGGTIGSQPPAAGGSTITYQPPPDYGPSLTATLSPSPVKRQQMVSITATVRNIHTVSADTPWGEISLAGGGAVFTAAARVPDNLADGAYPVTVRGRATNGQTLVYTLQLNVRGSIYDDINFVITD